MDVHGRLKQAVERERKRESALYQEQQSITGGLGRRPRHETEAGGSPRKQCMCWCCRVETSKIGQREKKHVCVCVCARAPVRTSVSK
jgi:hypothetical protein